MTNTEIAAYLAAKTPEENAIACDDIFTKTMAMIPEPLHEEVTDEFAMRGMLIGAGSQTYAESICGRKKAPAPH